VEPEAAEAEAAVEPVAEVVPEDAGPETEPAEAEHDAGEVAGDSEPDETAPAA
jgi:hypothetical protein